jgi:Insulin-induced protein (INSIG)
MTMQRKLQWQSTLQVSLTLALVNPVLWYLVDRSKPGFIFSAIVGIAGTFALLEINPDVVPSPAMKAPRGTFTNVSSDEVGMDSFISHEKIGVWTWIASVLFCSCVCFGNIGRRLSLTQQSAIS